MLLRSRLHGSVLLLLASALAAAASTAAPRTDDARRKALEEQIGWPITDGAAPGYVPDVACAECHEELWRSYQDVGMSQSFYALTPERVVEDLGRPFFHAASGNHYENVRRGDAFYQRRWREDAHGERYAEFEQRIDWVMGSGSNARTYFTRAPGGELFQLPVSWYSKPGRWAMSPGYDIPDHDDFSRLVTRRCMFCHDAYPDVPAGSDAYGEPHVFPETLPEGIGCQRCHGPGAEHVALALRADADEVALRAAVVNPARLAPERRDDVCFQCHLQPLSAVQNTVGRMGRGEWSFRPGQALDDFQIHFDLAEDRPRTARFEINHHPYRLRQSRCAEESGAALSCLTCHDPHRDVAPDERAEHYRRACLGCHELADCDVDAMVASRGDVPVDDCVACHMPKRRTEDVIEVALTDHLIRREPAPDDWLAPRVEVERLTFTDTLPYFRRRAVDSNVLALHESLFHVRSFGPDGIAALETAIEASAPDTPEPYLDLGTAQLVAGRPESAAAAFRVVTRRFPGRAVGWRELGRALQVAGDTPAALDALRKAYDLRPDDPDTLFALAASESASRPAVAITHYRRGLELRPLDANALEALARLLMARRRFDAAAERFEAATRVDPKRLESWRGLATALRVAGDWPGAVRAWRLGATTAGEDADFEKKLAFAYLAAPDVAVRDPALALEHARRAARLAPRDADAASEVALALVLTGDAAGALEAAERARALGADPVVIDGVLVLAFRALGREADRTAADEALRREVPGAPAGVLRELVLELLEKPR